MSEAERSETCFDFQKVRIGPVVGKEDRLAPVAELGDMVRKTGNDKAGEAGHGSYGATKCKIRLLLP